MLVVLKDIKFI